MPRGRPGRPKGSKNEATYLSTQLRNLFTTHFKDHWQELLEAELQDAKKNSVARHYIFDQVLGRATEHVEHFGNVSFKIVKYQ